MASIATTCWSGRVELLALLLIAYCSSVAAQFRLTPGFELSRSVQVDEVASTARAHLERVQAFLADEQWDEAIETIRHVMEDHGGKVIRLDQGRDRRDGKYQRYITVRNYCHLRLAALADAYPDALKLYRQRVDPLAATWYDQGSNERQVEHLKRVVDEFFVSSYGDDALYALGEIALEQRDYSSARSYWERISPFLRSPDGRPIAVELRHVADIQQEWDQVKPWLDAPRTISNWLCYPDTNLNLHDVRARLILVSILEGSQARANIELELFHLLAPDARGRIAGREVNYVDALRRLSKQMSSDARWHTTENWPTFAGSTTRDGVAPMGVDLVPRPVWSIDLGDPLKGAEGTSQGFELAGRRVAEDEDGLLSYHPIFVDNLILINDQRHVKAFDLFSGRAAFGGTHLSREHSDYGVIYKAKSDGPPSDLANRRQLGVPRFTMTAMDHLLLARMGSPVTSHPTNTEPMNEAGYLIGLDLRAQGRLMPGFPIRSEGEGWYFEGTPVTDGSNVYVAMRRSDVRPQSHVACFDAQSGILRWRRLIASADTPGDEHTVELTNNLLTLHHGTLYYNTNLGIVAALTAHDGRTKWVTAYPRASSGNLAVRAPHFYRDLNPCVVHRGLLLVNPSDCSGIFALDVATGQMIWDSNLPEDAVHLLGVGGGNLIASGDRLWWINVHTGKVAYCFPSTGSSRPDLAAPQPRGYGRGLLAGDHIYWPTRSAIYVLSQHVDMPGGRPVARLRRKMELAGDLSLSGITGGNLFITRGHLIVATADRLIALNEQGRIIDPTFHSGAGTGGD